MVWTKPPAASPGKVRNLTDEHKALVEKVVNEITVKFDEVLRAAQRVQVAKGLAMTGPFGACSCSCGKK
jgi:DNA replication initiation complex subunit (GINS family)